MGPRPSLRLATSSPLVNSERGRLKPSSATGDGNSQQERDQQRTKRCFARDVTQDAQWHPWLSTRFYRAANSMDCPFHSFGDLRDGGFRFWNGIQAFVRKWGQRDVITHDLISKPTNSQSIKKRELFRYDVLGRYRPRCDGRRGGRVINSANAKPIAPAISIEPNGLSCTFFAIACEPSRKVSPRFS
jgi:hypothetical protein